ncbi:MULTISPECIES: hypothetical protein [unclassified Mesorhizobium]|uniref:hypothetical protein n=1 Tax=unclassified Mesorhizobium TaxID=325217 RepID=UPI003014CD85
MTNEPKTITNAALDKLPLFATDNQVAVAIVGKERAKHWIVAILPVLERKGFPGKDPAHGGRPVPLVRKFYDAYFGITAGISMAKPDGEEREWVPKRARKAAPAD